jgi:hypothetical protein
MLNRMPTWEQLEEAMRPTRGLCPQLEPLGPVIASCLEDHSPGSEWVFIAQPHVCLPPGVFYLERDFVRPALAGWRRSRLPADWEFIEVVPDWICEVVTPGTGADRRVVRRRVYAQAGVAHYWIVDTAAKTLEAAELRSRLWCDVGAYGEHDVARVAPFHAVELQVGPLFAL